MDSENKPSKRGGRRPGSGRPRTNHEGFVFRANGEVAEYIKQHPNKSAFIIESIRTRMRIDRLIAEREANDQAAEQEPDFSRIGRAFKAEEVAPLIIDRFDVSVVAGFPITLNNDTRPEKVDLLRLFCPHPEQMYLIDVHGDSMIDSGIEDGDLLIIDKSNRSPREDEVALCEHNGDYTVKFVRRRQGKTLLVPANPDYPAIEMQEGDTLMVWGIVAYIPHRPHSV